MDIQEALQQFENELNDFSCYENQLDDKAELQNSFNKLKEAINYTHCCKSDSEQLCANCLCKPTQKLGFCNDCFDNIYYNA
jgi:hypothetical protein